MVVYSVPTLFLTFINALFHSAMAFVFTHSIVFCFVSFDALARFLFAAHSGHRHHAGLYIAQRVDGVGPIEAIEKSVRVRQKRAVEIHSLGAQSTPKLFCQEPGYRAGQRHTLRVNVEVHTSKYYI